MMTPPTLLVGVDVPNVVLLLRYPFRSHSSRCLSERGRGEFDPHESQRSIAEFLGPRAGTGSGTPARTGGTFWWIRLAEIDRLVLGPTPLRVRFEGGPI